MIGGTAFLYGVAHYLKGKEWYYYPVVLVGSGILFALILLLSARRCIILFISSLFCVFRATGSYQYGAGSTGLGSLDLAWMTFNYGIILMVGGALVMLYNNLRDEHPHQIFALVWSLVMLFSTWQHIRYEYYLAVNIALLSAVCVSFAFEYGVAGSSDGWYQVFLRIPKILNPVKKVKRSPQGAKSRKKSPRRPPKLLNLIILT